MVPIAAQAKRNVRVPKDGLSSLPPHLRYEGTRDGIVKEDNPIAIPWRSCRSAGWIQRGSSIDSSSHELLPMLTLVHELLWWQTS